MKKSNEFLSNTRFGIDKNVLLTMVLLASMSTGLLAFKLGRTETCKPFTISAASVTVGKSVNFYIGDPVNFIATVADNQQVSWDFGDHTPYDIGNTARHIYVRDAKYTVTATVNGKCIQTLSLNINPLKIRTIGDPADPIVVNPITGQDAPLAGVQAAYTSNLKAEKYEWNVLNSPIFTTQNTQSAVFNFPIQGPQIIELKLNGDPTKVYRKQVNVLPGKPMAVMPSPVGGREKENLPTIFPPIVMPVDIPKKEEVKKPEPVVEKPIEKPKEKLIVADEVFRMRLEAVVRGDINVAGFNDILCDGGATRILVENDDNRWETLAGLCQLFYKNKKIKKIWDVRVNRKQDRCVDLIYLKYKKGFL